MLGLGKESRINLCKFRMGWRESVKMLEEPNTLPYLTLPYLTLPYLTLGKTRNMVTDLDLTTLRYSSMTSQVMAQVKYSDSIPIGCATPCFYLNILYILHLALNACPRQGIP